MNTPFQEYLKNNEKICREIYETLKDSRKLPEQIPNLAEDKYSTIRAYLLKQKVINSNGEVINSSRLNEIEAQQRLELLLSKTDARKMSRMFNAVEEILTEPPEKEYGVIYR